MRILQVLPAFGTGGVEEGTLAVSTNLIQAGHASFIASSGGPKVKEAIRQGARHFTLPLHKKSPLLALRMIFILSKIIRQNQIQIVHARSRWPAWIAYFAAKYCGIPFMTTFHGHHKARNGFKRFYNSIMVRTRDTIAVSSFMVEYIKANYAKTLKDYQTRLHLIPRGIDETVFDPMNIDEMAVQKLRQTWEIPAQKKIILMPARMTRLKGHDVFIEALHQLKNRDWIAVILGGQASRIEYEQELVAKIQSLGLQDHMRIQPAIHTMPLAYALADVVVCPTTQAEAFGRVIIESQAMGKPIITSDIGEPTNLVEHEITGWKFTNKDANALAQCLEAVINLNNLTKKTYAEKARQYVLENYTKTKMCDKTLQVYASILNR